VRPGLVTLAAAGAALLALLATQNHPVTPVIDYPRSGSLIPPDMEPPTVLFREPGGAAEPWRAEIGFEDGAELLSATLAGQPM
jgi:hypothetical protein